MCHDIEAFKWNTKTCALWHLVKIEFLLSDVQKDLYLLNSPCLSLNSPIQATTNTDELIIEKVHLDDLNVYLDMLDT